jgi:hypothetical protein
MQAGKTLAKKYSYINSIYSFTLYSMQNYNYTLKFKTRNAQLLELDISKH